MSAFVSRIAFPNPLRPKRFVFVIKLLFDAVTLFVSWSLLLFVAVILWVFTTVTVGVLLLMSSMVTFVFGDLGNVNDADNLKMVHYVEMRMRRADPMPEKVLF